MYEFFPLIQYIPETYLAAEKSGKSRRPQMSPFLTPPKLSATLCPHRELTFEECCCAFFRSRFDLLHGTTSENSWKVDEIPEKEVTCPLQTDARERRRAP